MVRYPFLPLSAIDPWLPLVAELGVSRVARSARGFLSAYRRAGGEPSGLSPAWRAEREGFCSRFLAMIGDRQDGALWVPVALEAGRLLVQPTRSHLALICWAYSPDPAVRRVP